MTSEEPIETHRLVVAPEAAGQRFDAFLASHFTDRSRVQLRRLINAADATINGKRRKAAYHVQADEEVQIRFSQTAEPTGPLPEDVPLTILFEDEHLVVIDKPSGMVVHPSKGHWSGTLAAALVHHFQQLSAVGGSNRPGIVHRLDRDTSGVILVAKSDVTHLGLSKQFEERTIEKEYFAICRGSFDRDRDTVRQPIGIHPYQREKMAVRANHATSREASTFYEVTERMGRFASLRLRPKTGRTHQLRVHMAHLGCPILCDPLYSGRNHLTRGEVTGQPRDASVLLRRLALHARRLKFTHPVTSEIMEVIAEPPAILLDVVDEIRLGAKK